MADGRQDFQVASRPGARLDASNVSSESFVTRRARVWICPHSRIRVAWMWTEPRECRLTGLTGERRDQVVHHYLHGICAYLGHAAPTWTRTRADGATPKTKNLHMIAGPWAHGRCLPIILVVFEIFWHWHVSAGDAISRLALRFAVVAA